MCQAVSRNLSHFLPVNHRKATSTAPLDYLFKIYVHIVYTVIPNTCKLMRVHTASFFRAEVCNVSPICWYLPISQYSITAQKTKKYTFIVVKSTTHIMFKRTVRIGYYSPPRRPHIHAVLLC